MAGEPEIVRRSVAVPGASCVIRAGAGALTTLGSACATAVGHPQRALLLFAAGSAPELVEEVRRELTSSMFYVSKLELAPQAGTSMRSLTSAEQVLHALDEAALTADDCLVAVGDTNLISLAIFCGALWCGGMAVAAVPGDWDAALECMLTPRGLDMGSWPGRIRNSRGYARVMVCDTHTMTMDPAAEFTQYAEVLAVATAVADSTRSFSKLAEHAEGIVQGDHEMLCEQMLDSMKSRGRLASSNVIATRRALEYGRTFAQALASLVPGLPASVCLADALRFSARLAAGVADADIDLVFEQDALLARLQIPEPAYEVDPKALGARLREICFAATNRFLLPLPLSLGKVRHTSVDDAELAEHMAAWTQMVAHRA